MLRKSTFRTRGSRFGSWHAVRLPAKRGRLEYGGWERRAEKNKRVFLMQFVAVEHLQHLESCQV